MPEARVSRVGREMKKFPGMSTSHACRRGPAGLRRAIAALTSPLHTRCPLGTRCLARVHRRCSRGLPSDRGFSSSGGGRPGASLAGASKMEPGASPISGRMNEVPAVEECFTEVRPGPIKRRYRLEGQKKDFASPTKGVRWLASPGTTVPSVGLRLRSGAPPSLLPRRRQRNVCRRSTAGRCP